MEAPCWGYGDAIGCPLSPEIVKKEMQAYIKKNSRTVLVEAQSEDEEEQDVAAAEEAKD
jgi:predicted metal-binding protein